MKRKSEIPDPLRKSKVKDGFWGALIARNQTASLPHYLDQCEKEGCMHNMKRAAGRAGGDFIGNNSNESNLFKVMEGMAYSLALSYDPEWDSRLDDLIELIGAAQEPDGYLHSYYSQCPGERYKDIQKSHELYCQGHLIESAVAHVEATGKRSLLDVAIRVADHVDTKFGPGKMETAPGHQEIEMALVRLYHATGEKRDLDLARFFVDIRGEKTRVEREYGGLVIDEGDRFPGRNRPPQYRQDHEPILQQRYATGHAVRAGYLYAALADVAMEYDSPPHADAARAIWENVVGKKLYISGGVGTHQYHDEGYGDDYVLPNTGYCETCGGIAFLLFSHRMGLLTGESKYADVIELILYNHFLSSTDISGCNTFYRNPLSAQGPRKRLPWNNPACCPSNVVRIIPQVGRLIYGRSDNTIYVDQFVHSTVACALDSGEVTIVQETDYPWKGTSSLTCKMQADMEFSLNIRIPGWALGKPVPSDLYATRGAVPPPRIMVNGIPVDATPDATGYCVIHRIWTNGDCVQIDLPMPVRRVYAHPKVEANRGRVALMRGPLLYCLEETDMGKDPEECSLAPSAEIIPEWRPDLLGGTTLLTDKSHCIKAVPFYLWNNREPGKMLVWMREA